MYESPSKILLINLATNDILRAQFNPTELSYSLKPVWNRQVIPGMSHPIHQFSHTDATEFEFELTFSVTTPNAEATDKYFQDIEAAGSMNGGRPGATTPRVGTTPAITQSDLFTVQDREYAENFLRALTVPTGTGTVVTAGPAPVLVVWPFYCTFEAQVSSVKIKHTRFNRFMAPTFTVASVSVFDVHDLRFTAEDVMASGWNTPGSLQGNS